MSLIDDMAYPHRPKQRRTAVRLSPHPFVVLNKLDGGGADFHFLPNACVPNQKAMMLLRISISSSENTFSIAIANGMPVV